MTAPASGDSIRRRLLIWLLAALVSLGVVALFDTWREAVATANTVSDRVLAGSALAIAERVVVSENGTLEVDIPYVALEMLTSAAQDRVFYRVDGPQGTFVTGYETLPTIANHPGEGSAFADAEFRGEKIRLAALGRSASTGISSVPFVVTVAETTIARGQLSETILLRSALRLAILIAVAAAVVWFAVAASLSPLARLGAAIARRSPSDLHPIDEAVPAEVRGLVDTVNSFMARLGTALAGLRHFTGNASHQLRTPLAIMRTQFALSARADTLAAAREAARTGDAAVAHAERVLAQLLLLAKIEETATERAMQRVELAALARAATAERIPEARAAGIDLGFEGHEPVTIRAEPLLVGELIGNLIGNALAYAGRGAEVTVRVAIRSGRAVLEVEDNGPGIPPERLDTARRRFWRGPDPQRPGAGLGLPIVEEIATLFNGALALAPGSRGGLSATVTLPVAATPEPATAA
ncbi:MAG: sensor histidine kinase N-terminal domain-containing protein [Rhizobiaceae bacterium]|nr:sensor histidine kinase N-terminal domain-containing protein [Rhizobiaceae bacterium]